MSRYFLGPIKNSTWKDFIVRVGGALAVVAAVIFVTQAYFSGYESYAVIVVAASVARMERSEMRGSLLPVGPGIVL